ncbi:MAG: DUF1232 domain-containing protein [Elusimicrobiaceae bacterium]|nr:DUF1232 domain-containing protein [Elusimicrobiaceae bacterium]
MENRPDENKKFTVNPLKLWRDVKDTTLMFFNVCCGRYPLPKRSLIWIIIFLAYVFIPFDLIPDPLIAMFGLGAADDLLVLVYILNKMSPDLEKFRFFRNAKCKEEPHIDAEVISESNEETN